MWQTWESFSSSCICILWWCGTYFLWKHLLNNEHTVSVSLTLSVQLKHIPLLSQVFSILDLPAVSFFTCFFFHFSFLLYFQIGEFFSLSLSFFSFSWNKVFHVLHVITNGILSAFLLNFVSNVPGHCRPSWMVEMCSSLSLFSGHVCVAALLPGFVCSVLEVISAMSR